MQKEPILRNQGENFAKVGGEEKRGKGIETGKYRRGNSKFVVND